LQKITITSAELGAKVKEAIADAMPDDGGKWTQTRLCEELSINKDVLSRFCRGVSGLPEKKIEAIAKALDCCFLISARKICYQFWRE
jgi:ribosome-binding protein aMBF1 (putative translation factor)